MERFVITSFILLMLLVSCETDDSLIDQQNGYQINEGEILKDGNPIILNGVNALHSFGSEDLTLMKSWRVQLVREFIGNLREQPINGSPILDSNGSWLHPLDEIVLNNRAASMVTILCPFGWVNENGTQLLFTGLNPTEQDFYSDYLNKMQNIASHFAGQNDVWIEVWNEPYHWNNENGYSHNLWKENMIEMIQNLRDVTGFDNIIVVPGNEQGQSEDAILDQGSEIKSLFKNILFDIHAYEKWLNQQTTIDISKRFQTLQNHKTPFIFGEIGVRNIADLMDPTDFLLAAQHNKVSALAWLWKREAEDQSALLNEEGHTNDLNNNHWGSSFKAFLSR